MSGKIGPFCQMIFSVVFGGSHFVTRLPPLTKWDPAKDAGIIRIIHRTMPDIHRMRIIPCRLHILRHRIATFDQASKGAACGRAPQGRGAPLWLLSWSNVAILCLGMCILHVIMCILCMSGIVLWIIRIIAASLAGSCFVRGQSGDKTRSDP